MKARKFPSSEAELQILKRNSGPRPKRPTSMRRKLPRLTCPLCGAEIWSGGLVGHKIEVHGESSHLPTLKTRPLPVRVRVLNGGLPSLGKGAR